MCSNFNKYLAETFLHYELTIHNKKKFSLKKMYDPEHLPNLLLLFTYCKDTKHDLHTFVNT